MLLLSAVPGRQSPSPERLSRARLDWCSWADDQEARRIAGLDGSGAQSTRGYGLTPGWPPAASRWRQGEA